MSQPLLYHFAFSMYPEKVRWALDFKGIAHRRRTLLPGPHLPQLLALSGQKSVPVWRDEQGTLAGSARILDHLERHYPGPSLLPADPAARAQALDWQRWLDEEVGAWVRLAGFHALLQHPRYLADLFSGHLPGWQRLAYAAGMPLIAAAMRLDMRITAANARRGRAITAEALERIAQATARRPYLVGATFSIADLSAASVLALAAFLPEQYPLQAAQPYPAAVRDWQQRWQDHPGTAWVRRIYREHRGAYQGADRAG